jgi:hypothetical protein
MHWWQARQSLLRDRGNGGAQNRLTLGAELQTSCA